MFYKKQLLFLCIIVNVVNGMKITELIGSKNESQLEERGATHHNYPVNTLHDALEKYSDGAASSAKERKKQHRIYYVPCLGYPSDAIECSIHLKETIKKIQIHMFEKHYAKNIDNYCSLCEKYIMPQDSGSKKRKIGCNNYPIRSHYIVQHWNLYSSYTEKDIEDHINEKKYPMN